MTQLLPTWDLSKRNKSIRTKMCMFLAALFGMAKKKKKKFSFWCWLKGNTKHLNKTFQIFLRTELSLCGQ